MIKMATKQLANIGGKKTKLILLSGFLLLVVIGGELIVVRKKSVPKTKTPRIELSQNEQKKIRQNQIQQKRSLLVKIKTDGFSPASVNLARGGVVTWENTTPRECWLTGNGWQWPIRHSLKKGGHFSQEFDRPGQFPYGCRGWPIKGIINVR